MMAITNEFKNKVRDELLRVRANYDGTDNAFSIKFKIGSSYFNQIKNGKTDIGMADSKWIFLARELGVGEHDRNWKTAKTAVFSQIEEQILFCQEHSKSMIFVDECEIGKTHTAKYLSRTLRNCFYVDASQASSQFEFIRQLAKTIGLDQAGKSCDIKENIKYYLKVITKPIIIIDEAGDLEYNALLNLKEFWNATEGVCGWYLMGADGLRAKIEKGIKNRKVGYREIFSRFSSKYRSCVPLGQQDKIAFYKRLIADVLEVNMEDKRKINQIINKCITKDEDVNIGGLRRAESILKLYSEDI
jgi:hypothetical protein